MKHIQSPIIILAIIAAVGGLFLWGRITSPSNTAVVHQGMTASLVTSGAPAYDFASVSMRNGRVSHDFEVTNDSGKDLTLVRAMTSCMCTEAFVKLPNGDELGPFGMPGHGFVPPIDRTVKAGETFTVSAVFDPAAHGPAGIGRVSREIILETDQGQKSMRFTANVTP